MGAGAEAKRFESTLGVSVAFNVYHYKTPVNDLFYANNPWLPRSLSALRLHFNFHGIHHKSPAIPWIHLPSVFRKDLNAFDGNYFEAAFRQLSGPLPVKATLAGDGEVALPSRL